MTLIKNTVLYSIGLVAAFSGFSLSAQSLPAQSDIIYLNQGWTAEQRNEYYWLSQGSALLSHDIYLALEAKSGGLFNSPENSAKVGLLMDPPNPKVNPDNLPIGVAKADIKSGQFKGQYIGLTCAACHTGQIQYKNKQIRIDGANALRFDLTAWMTALSESLDLPLNNEQKFKELSKRIQARGAVNEEDLRKRLKTDATFVKLQLTNSFVHQSLPGPGRADALTSINNANAAIAPRILENTRPTLAAVKPPFLWDTPQSAWVEWSAVADNPLTRNFGESLSVFARLDLQSKDEQSGLFESTVDVRGLVRLEKLLRVLAPPQWPQAELGTLDQAKVDIGKKLFTAKCAQCHSVYPHRWDEPIKQGKRMIANSIIPQNVIGTDNEQLTSVTFDPKPTMLTRHLAPLFNNQTVVSSGEFFQTFFKRAVMRSLKEAGSFSDQEMLDMNGYTSFIDEPKRPTPLNSYKAAPRDGSWAIAPYLHNASVPNMYELLSPQAERSKTFYVGGNFDPVNLGLDTSSKTGFLFDTSLIGNSNAGHSYQDEAGKGVIGKKLSVDERYALIEYLKSIPNHPAQVTPYGGGANPIIAKDDPTWFNNKHPITYSK